METTQSQNDLELFDSIVGEMRRTYVAKNADYGSSFDKSMSKYGLVSLAVRLFDKLNRLESLASGQAPQVKDEKIEDTLLDIANYAVLGLMYITKAHAAGTNHEQVDLSKIERELGEIMSSYQKMNGNNVDEAVVLLPKVTGMIQIIMGNRSIISNAAEIAQTLTAISTWLNDIIGGKKAEPGLDASVLYDYQALCEFLQHPTEEGLPAAYETAQKIMNSNAKDWGPDRDFINQVVSAAEQIISMHDGATQQTGKVVPFGTPRASQHE
jgi:hypothetical protein